MNVQEAYDRIVFKIGTPNDTSARAINPQVSNIVIMNELYDQLRTYANITKGIQDVYSFSLNRNISFVSAPPLALRTKCYNFCMIITNGRIFPMTIKGARDVFPNFPNNPVNGITNWLMPWNAGHTTYLSGFPNTGTSALTTTLSGNISGAATTLPVVSTAGFINNFGRVTIGTEKILYEYKDATNFYRCVRGAEQSTATTHSGTDTVSENNVILFYSRLPVDIQITTTAIPAGTLAMVLEPCDEHMEGIIKAVIYNLLLKIDVDRSREYKQDYEAKYEQYATDIRKGYGKTQQNVNIRSPFQGNESGIPYGTNMIY